MDSNLKKYLEKEWKYNNHRKYQKYFEVWLSNITETQEMYFTAQMNGKMSIY